VGLITWEVPSHVRSQPPGRRPPLPRATSRARVVRLPPASLACRAPRVWVVPHLCAAAKARMSTPPPSSQLPPRRTPGTRRAAITEPHCRPAPCVVCLLLPRPWLVETHHALCLASSETAPHRSHLRPVVSHPGCLRRAQVRILPPSPIFSGKLYPTVPPSHGSRVPSPLAVEPRQLLLA
jgi:hypothetical protein